MCLQAYILHRSIYEADLISHSPFLSGKPDCAFWQQKCCCDDGTAIGMRSSVQMGGNHIHVPTKGVTHHRLLGLVMIGLLVCIGSIDVSSEYRYPVDVSSEYRYLVDIDIQMLERNLTL